MKDYSKLVGLIGAFGMAAGGLATTMVADPGINSTPMVLAQTSAQTPAETSVVTSTETPVSHSTMNVFDFEVTGFDMVTETRLPKAEFYTADGDRFGHMVLDTALCRSYQDGVYTDLFLNKLYMYGDNHDMMLAMLAMRPSDEVKLAGYIPTNAGDSAVSEVSLGLGTSKEGLSVNAGVGFEIRTDSMETESFSDISEPLFGVEYYFNKPLVEFSSAHRNMARQCRNTAAQSALALESNNGEYDLDVTMWLVCVKNGLISSLKVDEPLDYRIHVTSDGKFTINMLPEGAVSSSIASVMDTSVEEMLLAAEMAAADAVNDIQPSTKAETAPVLQEPKTTVEIVTEPVTEYRPPVNTTETVIPDLPAVEPIASPADTLSTQASPEPPPVQNQINAEPVPEPSKIENGGVYQFHCSFDRSLCIGVADNKTTEGSRLVLLGENNSSTLWEAHYNGEYWYFLNQGTTMVANVNSDSPKSKDSANIYRYISGDNSQGWIVEYHGDNVRMKNAYNPRISLEVGGYAEDAREGSALRAFTNQGTEELTQWWTYERMF